MILTNEARNCHRRERQRSRRPHICQSHNLQHRQSVGKRRTIVTNTLLPWLLGGRRPSGTDFQAKKKKPHQSCRRHGGGGKRSNGIFIQLSNNWNSSHIITQMGKAPFAARKKNPGPLSFSESKCHKCQINPVRVSCVEPSKCFI